MFVFLHSLHFLKLVVKLLCIFRCILHLNIRKETFMKSKISKLMCAFLCLVLIATVGFAPMGAYAQEETDMSETIKPRPLKILAIGNSYTNNATEYISKIAESMGLEIKAASLYKDGCMIQGHLERYEAYEKLGHDAYYASSNSIKYIHLNVNGVADTKILSMQEAIASDDWDFIVMHQAPNSCDKLSKYWTEENPDIVTLYNYIQTELNKNNNTKCEIVFNQGWSFAHEMSIDNNYKWYPVDYENTRDFFLKIEETVAEAVKIVQREVGLDAPLDIIPSGEAMQLAKDEFGFGDTYGQADSLYADFISHLSAPIGRYMIANLWIEKLTSKAGFPVDCRTATYLPTGLSAENAAILRSIAHEVLTGEADSKYGDWRAVPNGDGLKITHYLGEVPENGTITVPALLGGKSVTAVENTIFKYVDGVSKVVFEGNGVTVEEGALDGMTKIESFWDGTSVKPTVGTGKDNDPYIITNAAHLKWAVSNTNTGVYFKLANDIYINDIKVDAAAGTVTGAENAKPWASFSKLGSRFCGTIDGDNHVISGLYINDTYTGETIAWNIGLGLMPSGTGTIKNLGIVNSYVKAMNASAAAFIGTTNNAGTNFSLSNSFVGEDVYIEGTVATGFVGGGDGRYITGIDNCYSLATLKAHGNSQGTFYGGITGQVWSGESVPVNNCYTVGRFFGQGPMKYSDCYTTDSGKTATGLKVLTSDEMKGANSATKLSGLYEAFTVTDGYPVLKSFAGRSKEAWSGFRVSKMEGDGSPEVPYLVATPENLAYLAFGGSVSGKNYKLTKDIYLNDIDKIDFTTGAVAEGYNAIEWQETTRADVEGTTGGNTAMVFKGKFDGDGHVVYGMWYPTGNNNNTANYVTVGLFGGLGKNVTIKNVGVRYAYVNSVGYAGAIAGFVKGSNANVLIDNCFSDETVTINSRRTEAVATAVGSAGILGGVLQTSYVKISNCYSLANVTGTYSNYKILASIWDCYNDVTIENCFADGELCGGTSVKNAVNGVVNSYCTAASTAEYKTWTQISASEMKGAKALLRMPNLGDKFIAQYKDYPTLRVFAPGVSDPDTSYWDGALIAPTKGSGTANDPYLIATPEEFAYVINLGGAANTFYKLTSDIYLNKLDKVNWTNGELLDENYVANEWYTGYSMTGDVYTNGTDNLGFQGTLDGDGYTVYGVYYKPGQPGTVAGLIPAVKTATIKNINLKSSFVSGGRWTAALVGAANISGHTLIVDKATADESVTVWGCNAGGYYYDGRVGKEPIHPSTPFASYQNISGRVDFESLAIGGVLGVATTNGTVKITNCLVTANLFGDKCTTQYSNEYANGGKPYTVAACGTIFGVMGTCWDPKSLTFEGNITKRAPINNNNGVLVSSGKTLPLTMNACYYIDGSSNREGAVQLTAEQLTGANALSSASGLSSDVWYAVKADGAYPAYRYIGTRMGDVDENGIFSAQGDMTALRKVIIENTAISNGDSDGNGTVDICDLVKLSKKK